jgi:hypothetical protein
MAEVAGKAKLVDSAAVGASSALTATLPRSELEAALQDEAGADLFLEIARIENGERNDRRITVEWSREELEQLLEGASGESVSISFDGDELERMLNDPDFEAHGLREKAAIISVALVGAAAAVGGANAQTLLDGGGGTAAPAAVAGMVTDNTSGAVPGAVTGFVTDASTGGVAAPAAADPGGTNFVTDTASGGQPGAVTSFATDASTSGDTGAVSGLITDTGSEATRSPAEPSGGGGGGFSVPGDALGGVALAGGIALLLTGAAVAGRSRRHGAQPA